MLDRLRQQAGGLAAALAVFVVVFAARAGYVHAFGSAAPFFDQWDAEGDRLLAPWINGTLRFGDLLAAHNEHRILWTRLLTLGMHELGGGWDNRALAMGSAAVAASLHALLALLAWRGADGTTARAVLVGLAALLGVLPFAWENILVGFQSQFAFMALFSCAAIALAAQRIDAVRYVACTGLAVAAALSMASGVVGIVAAAATCAAAMVARREVRWSAVSLCALLLGLAAVAYRAIPDIAQHGALRPQGIGQLLDALAAALSWPAVSWPWAAVLIWLPFVAATLALLRGALARSADLAAWGLGLMAFGQAMAMATSRGVDLEQVPSRYTELLAIGLFANAYLGFRLAALAAPSGWRRTAAVAAATLGTAMLIGALGKRSDNDLGAMRDRSALTCSHQALLARFLSDGDPAHFDGPSGLLPYPNPARLALLAERPALRPLLHEGVADAAQARCFRQQQREIAATYGLVGDTRLEAMGLGRDGRALPITAGGRFEVEVTVPRPSRLAGAGLLVGTYGGRSDGTLRLRACTPRACAEGDVALSTVADNTMARVALRPALALAPGEPLRLAWTTLESTTPVAAWTFERRSASAAIVVPDGHTGRRPAMELVLDSPR